MGGAGGRIAGTAGKVGDKCLLECLPPEIHLLVALTITAQALGERIGWFAASTRKVIVGKV